MPLVTGPSSAIQPVQLPDMVGDYAKLAMLKNQLQEAPLRQQALQQQVQAGQQSLQSGQLSLNKEQQDQQDQQAFRAAMQDPSLHGKTIGDVADVLAQKGAISQGSWVAAKKADTDQRKALSDLDEKTLANRKAAHDATSELFNNAMNMPDEQLAANWPQIAQQYDSIPGNQKIPLNPQQPMSKQQLAQFGPMLSMGNSYFDQELARRQKGLDLQKKQQDLEMDKGKIDPTSPLYAPSPSSVALGTAPGAAQIQANEVKQAASKAGAEAAARQPYEAALARQRQALSQGDPTMAAKLLIDGDATLSELKARGSTPDFIARTLFQARQQSGGKYNAQKAEADFKVAQSPTNVAFFGSAKSLTDPGGTLDQVIETGKTIPQGQIPAFNSIADWEKAASGSGPIAAYAAKVVGFADDYAKVMGGGVGSDTSRSDAAKLIAAKASPEARGAAVNSIRDSVKSQINGRIGKNDIMRRMYGEGEAPSTPATGGGAPNIGDTKKFPNGKTGKWDGTGWEAQ